MNKSTKSRILLADDHLLVRSGIRPLAGSAGDMGVITEAGFLILAADVDELSFHGNRAAL